MRTTRSGPDGSAEVLDVVEDAVVGGVEVIEIGTHGAGFGVVDEGEGDQAQGDGDAGVEEGQVGVIDLGFDEGEDVGVGALGGFDSGGVEGEEVDDGGLSDWEGEKWRCAGGVVIGRREAGKIKVGACGRGRWSRLRCRWR